MAMTVVIERTEYTQQECNYLLAAGIDVAYNVATPGIRPMALADAIRCGMQCLV